MVLIKSMDMPKSCYDCQLEYDCCRCIITGTRFWGDVDTDKRRLPDCPLTEVKSYGPEGTLYKES